MNTINNNNVPANTILQNLSVAEKEAIQFEQKVAKEGLETLGQNNVTAQDIDGANLSKSISFDGTPELAPPSVQAGAEVANTSGKAGLYGQMSIATVILELLLKSLEVGNQSRQLQREVSTVQQNISINEGLAAANKTMMASEKIKTGAIIGGVFGGLGLAGAGAGAVGMQSTAKHKFADEKLVKARETLKEKANIPANTADTTAAGMNGTDKPEVTKAPVEEQIAEYRAKEADTSEGKKTHAEKRALKEQGYDEEIVKKRQAQETLLSEHNLSDKELNSVSRKEVFKLQDKIDNLEFKKDIKQRNEARETYLKAGFEAMTGTFNAAGSSSNTAMQAEAQRLGGLGQIDNVFSETAKTERSKFEGNYDNVKNAIAAMNRIIGEILSSMNAAASSAARA